VSKSRKSFSKMLEELEEIASQLEEGDLDLESAIKKYEQGIKVYRECRKFLDSAGKKVEILSKDAGGNLVAKDFPAEAGENEAGADDDAQGPANGKTLF